MSDHDGVAILVGEVRELVRRRGLDPIGDRAALSDLVTDVVGDYATRASVGVVPPLADPAAAAQTVTDAVGGFGPLQPYLDDPEIEEIWLNAPSRAASLLSQPGVLTHITLLRDDRAARSVLD
jgi:pilus assembly protein CpaF